MRERVTFERVSEADDGAGGFTATWATLCERPARVQRVSSRTAENAGRTGRTQTVLVTLRYDSTTKTITTTDRMVWDDRYWMVTGPAENRDEKRQWITVECVAGPVT